MQWVDPAVSIPKGPRQEMYESLSLTRLHPFGFQRVKSWVALKWGAFGHGMDLLPVVAAVVANKTPFSTIGNQ